MNINSNNVYGMFMNIAEKVRDSEVKSNKMKLVGTKQQIEYWKTIFGNSVEYIQVCNFIKG